jgi:hypothetical protein
MHKPLSIHYKKNLGWCTKEKAELYEDRVVWRYIDRYGIQNVRGGQMSQTGRYHLLGKYIFTDDQWPFAKALAVALCLTFLYAGMYLWERYGT